MEENDRFFRRRRKVDFAIMDFCNERIRSKSIKECSSSKENDGNVMRVITFLKGGK